ncbi:hypothetical protein [Sphingobium sp. R-7]|uniref:hypothetical protein n=1 Tax=Sphingobium sp. R-7 TaxID=3375449 RepID=UPI00398A50FD
MSNPIEAVRWRHALAGRTYTFLTSGAIVTGAGTLAGWVSSYFVDPLALSMGGATLALGLAGGAAALVRRKAESRIGRFQAAELVVQHLFHAGSSSEILALRADLDARAIAEPAVVYLLSLRDREILKHFSNVRDREVRLEREAAVRQLCAQAGASLHKQIEALREDDPFLGAKRILRNAIRSIGEQKAAAQRQIEEAIAKSFLKWRKQWSRPDFTKIDVKIAELEDALRRLEQSPQFRRADKRFAELAVMVERRARDVETVSLTAIPQSREEAFDSDWVVKNALYVSALSVPVSVWGDLSQASDIFATLRDVNGNYAGMSDVDIWLDTLMMQGEQLAGLVSLTKGAYFEELIEADFGGVRFEHFNHPDTDVVIDGIEYQIKATDSASYIESVADHIPVISTSEIANVVGSIDGGYTNEALTDGVELVLGGPIIDLSDTALDAVFAGLGFISIVGLVKGIARGASIYRETGNAVEGLATGLGVTFEESVWAVINTCELVSRGAMAVATSRPARYLGGKIGSALRAAKLGHDRPLSVRPDVSRS